MVDHKSRHSSKKSMKSTRWLSSCGGFEHILFENNPIVYNSDDNMRPYVTTRTSCNQNPAPGFYAECRDHSKTVFPLLSSRYTKTSHSTAKSYDRRPALSQLFCYNQRARTCAEEDMYFPQEKYSPFSAPKDVAAIWIDMGRTGSKGSTGTTSTCSTRKQCSSKSTVRQEAGISTRTSSVLNTYPLSASSRVMNTGPSREGISGSPGRYAKQDTKASQRLKLKKENHNKRYSIQQAFNRSRCRNKMSSISEETNWKSAVDPKSGRTYYYNTKTLETQWRMPMELASDSERAVMEAKERQQKDFFASMEANILKNFAAGTISTPKQELKKDPSAKKVRRSMVRTISSMDEFVLKDLVEIVPSRRASRTSLSLASLGKTNAQRNILDPLQESVREDYSFEVSNNKSINFHESFGESFFGEESSAYGFEISPSELKALQELAKVTEEMSHLNDASLGNISSSGGFDFDPDDMGVDDEEDFRSTLSQPARALGMIGSIREEEEYFCTNDNPPVLVKPKGIKQPLTRRNTCGTMYVKSTMSQPDKDATIKVRLSSFSLRINLSSLLF